MKNNEFSIHWLISIILTFGIICWGLSFLVPKNLITISGEYLFSLDYQYHVQRLVDETNWNEVESYFSCKNCWAINHYSPYFSLIYMYIGFVGEFLGFYPLLFYVFLMLSSQLISIYIFLKLIFKKVTALSLFSLFLVFSLNTYKVSLISSGSWYGLTHALLIVYYSILIYILNSIEDLKNKQLTKYGFVFGLLISTFFSVTANYVPYIIYSTIILGIIFLKKIIINYKKFLLFILLSLIPPLVLLFPIYKTLLFTNFESIRVFSLPANNETFLNAITVRQWEFATNRYYKISLFFVLLFPIFSFLKNFKHKIKVNILLLIGTIFTVILLLGNNFIINVYLYLFNTLPLMQSMRSSHRLYFYVSFISIFVIAKWLLDKKESILIKYLWLILLIIVLSKGIFVFKQRVDFKYLPEEYFQVQSYFNKNINGKVLYLPAYPPIHKSLLNSYEWGLSNSKIITIYSNPFSTYLPFKNLVSYEQYYYPEYGIESVMEYSSEEFDYHIVENNIEYLIFDENFDWKLYSEFQLSENYELVKRFNKIRILKTINY